MTVRRRADIFSAAAAARGAHLRIAIVVERFIPGAGGVENVAWQVAHELHRVGEDVTVLAREASGQSALRVLPIQAPTFWQPLRVALFDRAITRATRVQTGRRPFDVVHGFARTRHQHLYRAGGGSHADYLRRTHGPLGRAARTLSPRHRLLLLHERSVFADPDQRIQCSSRLVADVLVESEGVARERILLLPNGVDFERFGAEAHRAAGRRLRAALEPDPRSGPVWLFAGSGWRRKGLGELLRALARARGAPHRVWVAGRDAPEPWRRLASRLGVADRVRFLGERKDLEVLYQAVDAMVLPTRYDPFANVTIEAAAAGLPIVTSRANGAAEWLGDEIRIVERPEDADALARALDELESASRRRIAGAAMAHRARQLGWEEHVGALRDEYRAIAARRADASRG